MGFVTEAATAIIGVILDEVEDVDSGGVDDLPAITTNSAAVLSLPFNQSSTLQILSFEPGATATVRLRFEIWIKHNEGAAAVTMQRGRDLGIQVAKVVIEHDGEGYALAEDGEITEAVDANPVVVGGAPWLVSTLTIPVMIEIT